jgi:hypothetical protein
VTLKDFRRFLRGKFLWMTSDVYVCSHDFDGGGDPWVLFLRNDGHTDLRVHVTHAEDGFYCSDCDV